MCDQVGNRKGPQQLLYQGTGKEGEGAREGVGDLPNTHWIQKCPCSMCEESRTAESWPTGKGWRILSKGGTVFSIFLPRTHQESSSKT